MLYVSTEPIKKWSSKEDPKYAITVRFDQEQHTNALMDEHWCPLNIRMQVGIEPARTREIIVMCETDEEALAIAKYNFSLTGSNFHVVNKNRSSIQK